MRETELISGKIEEITERGDLAVGMYTLLGYPSLSVSLKALKTLRNYGLTIFETAIPFSQGHSDELSEAIQFAHKVACTNGVSLVDVLKTYSNFRPNLYIVHEGTPIDSLANLFEEMAGVVDSVLLGWVGRDHEKLNQIAKAYGIDVAQQVSIDMDAETIRRTVHLAEGLVYLAVAPKTGGQIYPLNLIQSLIDKVKKQKNISVCCGFGIRTREQIERIGSLRGCDGVMIGTAVLESLGRSEKSFREYVKAIFQARLGLRS